MFHTEQSQVDSGRGLRSGPLRPLSRRSVVRPVLHCLLFAAFLCGVAYNAAAQTSDGRVLVVPFDNRQHEPAMFWLSEASSVLLTDDLRARGVGAISRAERVRAFERLHLPLSASLSRATLIKVGELVGASEIIVGTYSLERDRLRVDAHTIRIDVGRLQPDVIEQGPLAELFNVFDALAGRLSGGARLPAAARGPRPPLGAFESCIKGLIAESPATQATFLETAIKLFPGYDRAELALWEVRTEQGDNAAALAAARGVPPASPLAARARFLSGVSLLGLKRYDEAFGLFKALIDEAPVPPLGSGAKPGGAAYNNLGVLVIRRGATPQTGSAVFYLTKAADAEPGDADYLFNLGYAYALERNFQGAVYWLREAVRRDTADADAHYVLAAALQASGSTVEAERERELARQLSSHYEELEKRTTADRLAVPRGLERVRNEPEPAIGIRPEQALGNTAQREQRELAAFHLDAGRRLYEREQDREALVELRRAVYLSPYEAQAHLLIGRILLRAGRPKEAVDALKISIWSADSAAARVALAETYVKLQNDVAARAELDRALTLDPASADAKRILGTIK
jgi:tetratricopeptide (TPR) repeat protein